MESQKLIDIKSVLSTILNDCYSCPDYIFDKGNKLHDIANRPLYFPIVESFMDLHAFSLLYLHDDWSQAAVILRTAIEQISKVTYILRVPNAKEKFLSINKDKVDYYRMSNQEQKAFMKARGIKSKKELKVYFEYGWAIDDFPGDRILKNNVIKKAGLGKLIDDIDFMLNLFTHGELSVYGFDEQSPDLDILKRYLNNIGCDAINLFNFAYTNLRYFLYPNDGPTPFDNAFYAVKSFIEKYKE